MNDYIYRVSGTHVFVHSIMSCIGFMYIRIIYHINYINHAGIILRVMSLINITRQYKANSEVNLSILIYLFILLKIFLIASPLWMPAVAG